MKRESLKFCGNCCVHYIHQMAHYHIIIERFGLDLKDLGRDLKDYLIPSPCYGQGHLPLEGVR